MAAEIAPFNFLLIKTTEDTVQRVGMDKPLDARTLAREFDFRSSPFNLIGNDKIHVHDGVYVLWCESDGPENTLAKAIFRHLKTPYKSSVLRNVSTGNVAITFHKFTYDGDQLDGRGSRMRQLPLPHTSLRNFLDHINTPFLTKPPATKEELIAASRPRFLWTDCDTTLQEAHFQKAMDDTWAAELSRRDKTEVEERMARALVGLAAASPAAAPTQATAGGAGAGAGATAPSAFLAKLAAESAVRSEGTCPIGLEPLSSYDSLYVPLCGHVCGPSAAGLHACPVCRAQTAWACVKTPTTG